VSLHSYLASQQISATDPPFSALIMAAYRKADPKNAALLRWAWPELSAEFKARYWSAGGLLPGEAGYDARGDDNLPVVDGAL